VARIHEELEYRREALKKKKKKAAGDELEEIESISIESPRLSQVIGWQLVKLAWWLLLFVPRIAVRQVTGNVDDAPEQEESTPAPTQNRSARRRKKEKEKEKESWNLADET